MRFFTLAKIPTEIRRRRRHFHSFAAAAAVADDVAFQNQRLLLAWNHVIARCEWLTK